MKKEKTISVLFLVQSAMIAAIYVVLTIVFAPISFGQIQFRIAEALTILPAFTPAAIPGLFVGCLIGNILGGAILPDIIVGSMALPPIIANTVLIPFVLYYGYQILLPIPFQMLTVGIGEVLSCGILGMIVYTALNKYKTVIFRQ